MPSTRVLRSLPGRLVDRRDEERVRASREPSSAHRRRVLVCLVTVVVDAVLLRSSLGIPPGNRGFYVSTLGLALVLLLGGLLAGRPLRPGVGEEWARRSHRLGSGLAGGLGLLLLFLAGAAVVAQIPVLSHPVQVLLDHARVGSLPVIAVLTAVNGIAEERFYRGALYDAFGGRWAVVGSTAVYTAVTALAGIPLLTLAGLLLGLGCALLRRWSRGVLAATGCHLVWSLGMLFLLPSALDLLEPR